MITACCSKIKHGMTPLGENSRSLCLVPWGIVSSILLSLTCLTPILLFSYIAAKSTTIRQVLLTNHRPEPSLRNLDTNG